MKFKTLVWAFDTSPYAKRRPLFLRWLPVIVLGLIGVSEVLLFTMALSSLFKTPSLVGPSGFYLAGRVHNNEPKTKNLHLNGYYLSLPAPVDNQDKYYGEILHRGRNVQQVGKLYGCPTSEEVWSKIKCDLTTFGADWKNRSANKDLKIKTAVDVFYPETRGIGWIRSCAKVRLNMTASLNDSIIISKKYQSHYVTSGLDTEYEGRTIMPNIEQCTDVTLGITLRKTLDLFYTDLAKSLTNVETEKFKNVFFKVGSTDFADGSDVILEKAVDLMKHNQAMEIELDGFADNQGDLLKDKLLSLDRVKTVKSYLVHHGIRSRRITTKAFGATHLVSTKQSEELRRLNRRVEFVIIKS